MKLDLALKFAMAFDVAEVVGTYLLTNQIDLGIAGRDPGNGQPLWLVIQVDEAITSGGAATIQFRLASDDSATIHDTSSTEHLLTETFSVAQLAQGAQFPFALPISGLEYEQFLGVQAIIAGATVTGGAISAFLTLDPPGWKAYPDAQN